jgi:hypothetical protein
VREIADLVGVSRASVSAWVRDIELTAEQHAILRARNPAYNGQRIGQAVRAARAREERRAWQGEGRAFAQRGDAFHAAGWAEGAKCRNQIRLSNADPEIVRFFVRFLRTYFHVPDDAIRVTCNLFADHIERQHAVEQFWLDVAEVPRTSLCKSQVNVYSKYSLKKRANKLRYGTCLITVSRTRILQHIYGAIQEYAGFERPEWLD